MSELEKNPWKTLFSKVIYKNPWITLEEDQVIRPDGSPGIYSVVHTRIATGVVAVTPQLEIYLVGQYRYPMKQYSWEIIEGGADPKENPLGAIKRELKEEGGLEADTWLQLGEEFHLSNCFTSEIGYVYLARGLKDVGAQPDATEVLQLRRLPLSEAMVMVRDGTIKDTVSIVGLLRAEEFLRGQL